MKAVQCTPCSTYSASKYMQSEKKNKRENKSIILNIVQETQRKLSYGRLY